MRTFAIVTILNAILNAGFTQRQNGADWADVDTSPSTNECAETGQSPINLTSDAPSASQGDTFNSSQSNVSNVSNSQDKETNTFPVVSSGSSFTSTQGNVLGAGTSFDAQQFHWHAGSEHTIDGLRYDLEVHTVHYPSGAAQNGYIAAALGVMFDRTKYFEGVTAAQVTAIDNFFDDLELSDISDPTINVIRYGDLITALDTDKRWVQTGSVTTPPCARKVQWNVLRTVQPVKQHHQDLFMIQLNRDDSTDFDMRISGNWRLIQPIDTQDLKTVGGPLRAGNNRTPWHTAQVIMFIMMGVFALILVALFVILLGFTEIKFKLGGYKEKDEFNIGAGKV